MSTALEDGATANQIILDYLANERAHGTTARRQRGMSATRTVGRVSSKRGRAKMKRNRLA